MKRGGVYKKMSLVYAIILSLLGYKLPFGNTYLAEKQNEQSTSGCALG